MNIKNILSTISAPFCQMNSLWLFILIAGPFTFKFYQADDISSFPFLNFLLTKGNAILLFLWLYSVSAKANNFLLSKGLPNKAFDTFYRLSIGIIVLFLFSIVFNMLLINTLPDNFKHIESIISALIILSFIGLIINSSILLSSAEKEKTALSNDYYGTFFLFLIYPIGLFYIQPRIKNIGL